MTLKNAALLALIGTILMTALLVWQFVFNFLNLLRGLVPAVMLFSTFIPGAKIDADGLGSCTANSAMAALSNVRAPEVFAALAHTMGYTVNLPTITGLDDVVGVERYAIGFY